MNLFPPSPTVRYPIRTVSNFFENSRRYSQLKVHHQCCWHGWQIKKILKIYLKKEKKHFFKFTLRFQQSVIVSIICHRCHWHWWQICSRCRWYRWQILPLVSTTQVVLVAKFSIGVVETGGKYATGVVDTGGKFATGVVDTGGAPWLANISENFRNFLKLMLILGLGEDDSWKKPEAKNLMTLSL